MKKPANGCGFSEDGKTLKSTLVSRNVTINGKRTSVRLEPEMWMALNEISQREKCSSHDICSLVAVRKKENTSLTAAIRVFIMLYYRAASTEAGHERARHGDFEFMRARARLMGDDAIAAKVAKYWPGKGIDSYPDIKADGIGAPSEGAGG